MGYDVRDSKVTGNASRKDILHMQNVGASLVTLDLVNIYMMQLRYIDHFRYLFHKKGQV
jgi:hypothetical protein